MKTVTLKYYDPPLEPWGLTVTLPKSWLNKPTKKLVAHFFKAYATEFPDAPRGDVDRYELVDVATGAEIGDGVLADVTDGAVLSVAARKGTGGAADGVAAEVDLTAADVEPVEEAAAADAGEAYGADDYGVDASGPSAADRAAERETAARNLSEEDCEKLDEDEFEQYCVYMFDQHYRNNKFMSYVRVRKSLRGALRKRLQSSPSGERGSSDDGSASSSAGGDDDVEALAEKIMAGTGCVGGAGGDDESDGDESDDDDAALVGAPRERTAPKDWGAINFRKALCPNVVAGRRCGRGDECTYAHHFDQLRIETPEPPPAVCGTPQTAEHPLSAPEWWQMGVFAETARQQPHLWRKMSDSAAVLNEARAIRSRHRLALRRAREALTVHA